MNLKMLYSLRVLDLSANLIENISKELCELKQLEYLYLEKNTIKSIDEHINQLNELKVLLLSENEIATFPTTFYELFHLTTLYLNKNKLSALPSELSRMISLKYLDLSDNPFTSIPTSYNQLKKLEKLYLNNNKLAAFPQVLYDLQNNKTKVIGIKSKELFKIRILFSKARNKKLIKEFDAANENYKKILNLDTNNIQAMIELSSSYLELNKFDSSVVFSERALKKDPPVDQLKELKTLYNYGVNKTNKETSILQLYKDSVSTSDNKAEAFFDLGRYYFDRDDFENSLKYFEEALMVDTSHQNANFYYAISALASDNKTAFDFATMRFIILSDKDERTKTILPFLMLDFNMKTGVGEKGGSTAYLDSYIIRNNEKQVVYRTENPSTYVLMAMLSDILKLDKKKVKSKGKKKNKINTDELLDTLFHANMNNVEILKKELSKFCSDKNKDIDTSSFYYQFYYPYFKELLAKNYLETYCYLINDKRNSDQYISKWLKDNTTKVVEFRQWSENYQFFKGD